MLVFASLCRVLPYFMRVSAIFDFIGIDQTKMRVGIQSDTDIRMPHQILEGIRIHSLLGFLAAVGVPAYMRSDLRHLHPVDLVIFLSEF